MHVYNAHLLAILVLLLKQPVLPVFLDIPTTLQAVLQPVLLDMLVLVQYVRHVLLLVLLALLLKLLA